MNQIDHVGLFVKDLAKSIDFYEETLGLKVTNTMNFGESKIAFLDIGGGLLELLERHDTEINPPKGYWNHTAFKVDNFNETISKLEKIGLELRKMQVDNGSRIAFFKDPDGHDIEIME